MKPADPVRATQLRRWSLGVGAASVLVFGPGLLQWIGLSWRQHQLDRRLASLSAERERLVKEQQRLETDPGYVEGLIRTTFKWAQDGELVIPLDEPAGRQNH
jgi:cell division protein FtsB